jgi:hypothetical protein
MRKLKLDLQTLEVQSFRTEDRPALGGTVFGAMTYINDGCTGGAECNTYPQSACGNCIPSIRGCDGTYGCGGGTDWMTCGYTCATCDQNTCIESCGGTCFTCEGETCEGTC